MEAEIELKLFFPLTEQDALAKFLDSLPHSERKVQKQLLSNCYYDSDDLQLRRWDMGLRIRGCDQNFEQTIKTKGQVIGGVHARPEYNVALERNQLDLALFPQQIWPEDTDLNALQAQLVALFSTDFYRSKWHVYVDDSLVEVAVDIGQISANDQQEAICEIEFELLAGEPHALLTLGRQVAAQVPVRLGQASKAQRGYRLSAKASPLSLDALTFIALKPEANLKQTFISLLETGIERWQILESMLLEAQSTPEQLPLLSYRLRACIRLLRRTLEQFGLDEQGLTAWFEVIEQHLEFVEQGLSLAEIIASQSSLIARLDDAKAITAQVKVQLQAMNIPQQLQSLFAHKVYGQLQLALVQQLLDYQDGRRHFSHAGELKRFADEIQEASWQRILQLVPAERDLSSQDYQAFARALDESVFVGVAYGELYAAKERDQFRAPWQDLLLGIRTLAAYRRLGKLATIHGWEIQDWLQNKQESLLFAMEFSRRSALKKPPYWR
ncbi:inorganic triphosphatase [Shewanella waksmanii]|uniref:CYTH domain-containing protein n=1 Tax=Shewanella waksmanii TaxID=213783 RepID=UPI00048E085C|nr:CYTH and CHAD domain-containing protein [Shewanella waksmanii]